MRRPISVLIALVVMAAMVGALAAPALADHRGFFDNDEDCLYSLDCREEEFSEGGLPVFSFLGKLGGHKKSRGVKVPALFA